MKKSSPSATINDKDTPRTHRDSFSRFPKEDQLDDSLVYVSKHIYRKPKSGKDVSRHGPPPTLPGHPTRVLEDATALRTFLTKEFHTPKLNHMSPRLWLVATPNHSFISPIHEQRVRGRDLIIAEDPELHLTWIDNRVFIKPIPAYLCSHAFWERYLSAGWSSPLGRDATELIQPAVLGYLRSWTYLVRHESDFKLAKEADLIPRGVQYARFMRFIQNFSAQCVTDDEVSPRYRFGQLRLSRLNLWAKVFLGKWEFEQIYWQYWQYFQTFYAPLLFIFATFTVVLSAMQVGLSAPHGIWIGFEAAGVYFSVVTLLIIAITTVLLVMLFMIRSLKELVFAVRATFKRKAS